ncbi:PREDICTED: uncharacterized protein C16C10.8 [Ceratosolen solmsi marchali]|uniref:Uncharacterized protein C16C10.8 n=1 Tax=Ceratosolen solmsi marchali TaxID=326594 RepID=A0AAJ6YV65_9HYME|nr:PREDICTED: uncharacterized protein C16C10.8 [Ceratosolen solmsi marchali]
MVVFTCNNCGDSLQKPKVAKHYQFQCRNPVFVTCVDCLKDFRDQEYVAHTKCVSENERYGGKDYVPTKNSNKGERKQQAWLNIVQNVLNNSKHLTVSERNILSSISKYDNIPRKKPKFMNFIRSMTSNRANMSVVESVWDIMENAFKEATADVNDDIQKLEKQNVIVEENQNNSNIFKENDNAEDLTEKKNSKKSKKRLLETDENENNHQSDKRSKNNVINTVTENNITEDSVSKFSWKNVILDTVAIKGKISLKKLRKKVVAQYLADFPDATLEKATSKFEKKLIKVSGILIDDDKVKLL